MPALTRPVGLVLLALCCAAVLQARVYSQFDRERIRVVRTERTPEHGSIVVVLPDIGSLSGKSIAVVIRLRNAGPEAQSVSISAKGADVARVGLPPHDTIRADLSFRAEANLHEGDLLELRSEGRDWTLQYLELANVHGFSSGTFSFVITPSDATYAYRPSGATVVLLAALLMMVAPLYRFPVRPVRHVVLALCAVALSLLGIVAALPVISPYKVLLSVPAFSLCVMLIYSPVAVHVAQRPAQLGVTGLVDVFRRLISAAGRIPFRSWLASVAETGTGLAVWPVRAVQYLSSYATRRPVWTIGVVAGAVIVVAVLATSLQSTPPTHPIGDRALLEIYTLHAANGDLRLGAYSRQGWNHLGPMYFYVLAPLYELSGQREYSLDTTALLINLAAAFAAVMLMVRHGGWSYGVGMVVALALYFSRQGPGPYSGFADLLSNPWNAHIPILPLGLLLVLCASLVNGTIRALPWVALVASFIVQTHIGMAPCAVVLAAAAVIVWIRGDQQVVAMSPPEHRVSVGPAPRFWVFATIWLLALVWFLPISEQLAWGQDGNLAEISRTFFAEPRRSGQALSLSLAAFSFGFSAAVWPDAGIARGGPVVSVEDFEWAAGVWVIVQLVLLAVVCVSAVRTGRRFSAALCGLCLLASGLAFWSITQVPGRLGDYLVFWISIIGAVALAALVGECLRFVGARLPARPRVSAIAGRVVILSFCALLLAQGASKMRLNHERTLAGADRFSAQREAVHRLFVALDNELQMHEVSHPLFRIRQPAWSTAAGVILRLHKGGTPVSIEGRRLYMFTEAFASTGGEDAEFLFSDVSVARDVGNNSYRLVAQEGTTLLFARMLAP